jgi:dihydrofolate reductase
VAELKSRINGELPLAGSYELIQTLMAHDLVDKYRLWTAPVILGRGKRLFAGGAIPSGLRLLDTRTTTTNVAINTYERAGEVEYASWALDE